MKKVYIDNVLVETEKLSSIQIKKQQKDIKEFSKKKTSFSKPIKVLQTSANHRLFGNLFNINEVNGWDKSSRPLARIEVNNEVVLSGKCKLDSIDKKHYNIVVYKEETNLTALFDDEMIRGNEDSNKDVSFLNKYNIPAITREWMRVNMLRFAPRVDGLGIQYAHVSFGENKYDWYLDDEYIAPTLGVRELLEETMRSKGKTITFSNDILAYLNHMRIPFNGDYKELATSWLYGKYQLTNTDIDRPNTFAPPVYLFGDWRCDYDYKLDIAPETSTNRYYLTLKGRGIYTLRVNVKHYNNESNEYVPKVVVFDSTELPYTSSEITLNREDASEGDFTEKLFTATFESKSKEVSIYIGDDENTAKLSTDTFIEVVKDDSLYSGQTNINADKILPYEYKKVDLFNDVVKTFNATIEEDGDNIHLRTFKEFNSVGLSNKDWSDKIDIESVSLSTLASQQNTLIQYKFKDASDLYNDDFNDKFSRNDGDLERTEANKEDSTLQLNYSNTVCRPTNGNNQLAVILNKDGEFSTVHTPRFLFIEEFNFLVKNTWGYDSQGNKDISISHFPLLSNRFSNVVTDANNLVLSFNLTHTYADDDYNLEATGYNLFNKFYEQEEQQYSHENLMFLKCKANISAKDLAEINFNDNIYVNLGKHGAGYYRVNLIDYSSDKNKLSTLELIQINIEDIDNTVSESVITLERIELSQSNEAKKKSIQSIQGESGTTSGGGVSASTVALMIEEAVKDKLDKTGKAADSELLDGHDSTYFATQSELDEKANLVGGNTFTGTQVFEGDIIQQGEAYETHAEQVFSKDDIFILRDEAIAALGINEHSGFVAKLADGINDSEFGFDNTGLLKVGKVGGQFQTVATRVDDLVTNELPRWNDLDNTFDRSFVLLDDSAFQSTIYTGRGWSDTGTRLELKENNKNILVIDELVVRDEIRAYSFVAKETNVVGGALMLSNLARVDTCEENTTINGIFTNGIWSNSASNVWGFIEIWQ